MQTATASPRIANRAALADWIATQEAMVASLRIEAVAMHQRIREGRPARAGESHVTLWFGMRPPRPLAAHWNPAISTTDPPSRYNETERLTAFNGRFGTQFTPRAGEEGHTGPHNRGVLYPDRPGDQGLACMESGLESSLLGIFAPDDLTSDAVRQHNGTISFVQLSDGKLSITFARGPDGSDVWILDPIAGYALSHRRLTSAGKLVQSVTVHSFHEVIPGRFYFPREVHREVHYRNSAVTSAVTQIDVKAVVVNAPDSLDPARFVLEFPPGTLLQDLVGGRDLVVGHNAEELMTALAAEVQEARTMGTPTNWVPWWQRPFILVPAVCVGLYLGFRAFYRRGRRSSTMCRASAVVAFLCVGTLPAQYCSEGMRLLVHERVPNCALSAAVMCALHVSMLQPNAQIVERIASHMGLGNDWSTPVDLERIAEALRSEGMSVSAKSGMDFPGLCSLLEETTQRAVILHIGRPQLHFMVALRTGNGRVLISDPGVRRSWIGDRLVAHKQFLDTVSPLCLVVDPADTGTAGEKQVPDLGMDPAPIAHFQVDPAQTSAETITISTPVRNGGVHRVRCGPWSSSCSCIVGVRLIVGLSGLDPGKSCDLEVLLNPRKIVWSNRGTTAHVPLLTDSGETRTLTIECRFKTPLHTRNRIRAPFAIPASLVLARSHTDVDGSAHLSAFEIHLPDGCAVSTVTARDGRVSAKLNHFRSPTGGSQGAVAVFDVSFQEPAGNGIDVRDAISIAYSGKLEGHLTVPVLLTAGPR